MLPRKTSFEAVIEGFDADAPARWALKGKSLPYGQLQLAMETCHAQTPAQSKDAAAGKGSDTSVTRSFFDTLTKEIKRVDRYASLSAALTYPVSTTVSPERQLPLNVLN